MNTSPQKLARLLIMYNIFPYLLHSQLEEQGEEDEEDQEGRRGVYVPPKVAAVPYGEVAFTVSDV